MKRRLTAETVAGAAALDERDERLGLTPDLAARLRSVGARVRKHVAEGYANHHHCYGASSAPPSPSASTTNIFCTVNDTLHQVRSAWPPGVPPSSSPRKRGRAESDSEPDDESVMFVLSPHDRPRKPLRRMLTKTQSLPADAFSFSRGVSLQTSDSLEDDWN